MIAINNKNYYENLAIKKEIGKVRSLMVKKYKNNIYRWVHLIPLEQNLRLTEAQSAIGRMQLKKIKKNL